MLFWLVSKGFKEWYLEDLQYNVKRGKPLDPPDDFHLGNGRFGAELAEQTRQSD
jgi:hypothetical protein